MIRRLKKFYQRRARVKWFGEALALARHEINKHNWPFEQGLKFGPYSLGRVRNRWVFAQKKGRWWVPFDQCVLLGVAIEKKIKLEKGLGRGKKHKD